MLNEANNFLRCDDMSSAFRAVFLNANGFSWVITDLLVDLP
jgi:hypothetical protein